MPSTDSLDPDNIKANLRTKRVGSKILVYNTTSSTNDVAAEYARNSANDGLAVFAEHQTAGRGRAGTSWHSGYADSILCSVLLTDCKLNGELLSLSCAVAVADSLGRIGAGAARIKWPNDIILNGRKVAGILLESKPGNLPGVYVIGIGINCHQRKTSFPLELQETATSIDVESRATCDRILLAKRLLTCLDHWLKVADKSSKKVTSQWQKLSVQLGHRVALLFDGKDFIGNCIE